MTAPNLTANRAGAINTPIASTQQVTRSRAVSWWGMLILIINEAMIFATLLISYFYTRFNTPVWPPDGLKPPELVIPIILTIILVSSSFVIQWGLRSIRSGQRGRMMAAFGIGVVMALVFLGLQGYEYSRSEFAPTFNAYASLFFTITGIHGLHVIMAVLMGIYILLRGGARQFDAARYTAVENVALYWHFVDVVWLFVFVSLYLSVYL